MGLYLKTAVTEAAKVTPSAPPSQPSLPPLAPRLLMMAFWMLLGSTTGIRIAQGIWQFLAWNAGGVSIAVPIGGVIGGVCGVVLGRISNPRVLILLMAIFAGWSAGGVVGKIVWGDIGEICGQVVAGLVGGLTWATWIFVGRVRNRTI